MEWRTQRDAPFEKILTVAAGLLFFASLYNGSFLLFFLFVLCGSAVAFPSYYFKYVEQNVKLANPRQTVRLFAGDKDTFFIRMANEGRWPVFSGTFRFILDHHIECRGIHKEAGGRNQNSYSFPFHLEKGASHRAMVEIKGVKRGVARFRGIHLAVRDFFALDRLVLTYDPLYRTEVIVYPELLPVAGLERVKTLEQGNRPREFSLDEDLTSPTGTRSYVSSDPFNRIHWKASAKTGALQTKVFEKTAGMKWVLLLNIARERAYAADLEREISCLAYICKYAAEQGIPFEMYVNVKTRGKGEIMHLYAGEGSEQLAKAFELLARVDLSSVTVPASRLLAYADRKHVRNPTMILCHLSHQDDHAGILQKWKKEGYGLYGVEHGEHGSYLTNVAKRKAVSS
ncbi:MAG TPA: DUF58 domain-containing protein [Bacillales bacterium]|nr:DUF58 domain-containing protein [Bacillales bacterium]